MEKVWILTSQWTHDDDGNYDEQLHGVLSSDDKAKLWVANDFGYEYESNRTYWLMEWQVDDPKYQGPYFWRLAGQIGVWDKVFITGRVENGTENVDSGH